MRLSLTDQQVSTLFEQLVDADRRFDDVWPGDPSGRQPVHVVYGGAQLYKAGAAQKLGQLAQRSLQSYAGDVADFAEAFGLPNELAATVHERVSQKLGSQAIEDQRIDFEDGYGYRPDDEEDAHALSAADAVAQGMQDGTLPPFIGIRIKSFSPECRQRALRTLDLFLTRLAEKTTAILPDNFVICLPKVTDADQVSALATALEQIEQACGYTADSLKLEIMLETTQSVIAADGRVPIRAMVEAAKGRCVSVHFGTYDYTAACNISASHQTHDHPVADLARQLMQAALAGTGVFMSDGATTRMPIPPHKGGELKDQQKSENRQAVHGAWREHYENVRRSLRNGFYQSWDLNPAQLPARYAAVYAFFLEALPDAQQRLQSFINKAAQANLVGSTFDDAATGQGLLNFFLRGLACGALNEEDMSVTGLSLQDLQSRSFMQIVAEHSAK